MGGPPKDIEPSELWTLLSSTDRPTRVVPFPRLGPDGEPIGKIAMRVLTQEEQMICATAAERFAKDKLRDGKKDELGYETIYGNSAVVELLFRSCRREENTELTAFPTAASIREKLTADECGRLFEYYLNVQLELGPIVASLSEDECNAWVDRLVDGGLAASPFVLLSPEMQKLLAHFMASQIARFRKDRSSAGSPPESTPSVAASASGEASDDADDVTEEG